MKQKTIQTQNWGLVSWFGGNEKGYERLINENADKFTNEAVFSLNPSQTGHTIPNDQDLQRASDAVNQSIADLVRNEDFLRIIEVDGTKIEGTKATALRTALNNLDGLLPSMVFPPPQVTKSEVKPAAAGLFAVVGAVVGMITIAGICRLALGTANEGIIVGAALGALAFTWGLMIVAKNEALQRSIITILGIATFAEGALLIGRRWFPPLGWMTNKTGGDASSLKRMLAYIGLIVLIWTTRCKDEFDTEHYAKVLRTRIHHQLHCILSIIAVLAQIIVKEETDSPREMEPDVRTLGKVAATARKFKKADSLQEAGDLLDILIQELRNGGYEIDKPNPALFENPTESAQPPVIKRPDILYWSEEMREKYETFGLVEEGDPVAIMDEPVIQNGSVVKKGQVKKSKRGAV